MRRSASIAKISETHIAITTYSNRCTRSLMNPNAILEPAPKSAAVETMTGRRTPRHADRFVERDLVDEHPEEPEEEGRERDPDQPEVRRLERGPQRESSQLPGRSATLRHRVAVRPCAHVGRVVAHEQRPDRDEHDEDRDAREDERRLPPHVVDHQAHRRNDQDAAQREPRPEDAERDPSPAVEPPRDQRLERDEEHHLAEHAVDGRVEVPLPQLARRCEQDVRRRRGDRAEEDDLARTAHVDPAADERSHDPAGQQHDRDGAGHLATRPSEVGLEGLDVEADRPERHPAAERHRDDRPREEPPPVVDAAQPPDARRSRHQRAAGVAGAART